MEENSNTGGGNGPGDDPSAIVQTTFQNNGMETDPPSNGNDPQGAQTQVTNDATGSGSLTDTPGNRTVHDLHMGGSSSWNGCEMEKTILSPVRSLPGELDENMIDDGVWDWEGPFMRNFVMESYEVENEALSQLGLASANMNYCS